MIEFAFVMVINLAPDPLQDWEYVGSFNSCQEAALYVSLHYPDPNKVEMAYRCLNKETTKRILNKNHTNGDRKMVLRVMI